MHISKSTVCLLTSIFYLCGLNTLYCPANLRFANKVVAQIKENDSHTVDREGGVENQLSFADMESVMNTEPVLDNGFSSEQDSGHSDSVYRVYKVVNRNRDCGPYGLRTRTTKAVCNSYLDNESDRIPYYIKKKIKKNKSRFKNTHNDEVINDGDVVGKEDNNEGTEKWC